MKKFSFSNMLFIYLAGMVCLQPLQCIAQWSSNSYSNTVVCIEDGGQGGSILATDGNGGAILAWNDDRNGYSDVYAQHFNADGVAQWTANGISICNAGSYQNLTSIISDGAGGAILAWTDFRNVDLQSTDPVTVIDIFVQRVNGSGVVQWASNGISISRPEAPVSPIVMTTDNNGGAIISWIDNRHKVYAQGINANGTLKWTEKVIATDATASPAIVSDGSGGAIITWSDYRNQADQISAIDIYAQRISADGAFLWAAGGVGICTAPRFQSHLILTPDGSGGAIVTWLDDRDVSVAANNVDVFAQRVNANGIVQWATNGIGVCTTTHVQSRPAITTDQAGGAIIAWQTWTGFESTIALQRISGSGAKLWMSNGVPIGLGGKEIPTLVSDGSGGVILTWEDKRSLARDIYAQHVDANGIEKWQFGGIVVSNAYGEQFVPQLVLDNNEGVIITWSDGRNVPPDVYAQHVMADGKLGGANVVGNQTITFNSIPQKKFSDASFTLSAIASSNLSITYTSSNLAVATVSGSQMTIVGVGTTTITATQPGDANFSAAPPVSQQLVVAKGDQTISFNTLLPKAVGDAPFSINATTSSDLVVSFTSSNTSVATISGTTVTIVGLGSTNITASQAGNANYNAAENVVQPFSVKGGQSISFSAIPDKTLGDPAFILTATASSGLQPTFSSASDKISILGNQVTLLKAGAVTIKADQSGNTNFAPALQQTQTFCIAPAKPSITVTGLGTEAPVLASNSPSGNQWFKDGIAIGGATSQTFTVSAEGVYTLVTSIDNCTSVVSDEKTFIITGIENMDDGVRVFPNPMKIQLHVDVTAMSKSAPVSVVMYDMVGNVLHSSFVNETTDIDVGSYQTGIYLLKIQNGKQTIVKKLKK